MDGNSQSGHKQACMEQNWSGRGGMRVFDPVSNTSLGKELRRTNKCERNSSSISQKLSRPVQDHFTRQCYLIPYCPPCLCGSSSISSWYFLRDASPVAQTDWINVIPGHASNGTQELKQIKEQFPSLRDANKSRKLFADFNVLLWTP